MPKLNDNTEYNAAELLQFYLDNDLEEIISEVPQNCFLQKDLPKINSQRKTQKEFVKHLVESNPLQKATSPVILESVILESVISESVTSKMTADNQPARVIAEEKPLVENKFIKPQFSTNKAISTLAEKLKENKSSKVDSEQKFISLNEIIDRAKAAAQEATTLDALRHAVDNFDGCNLKKMATNTVFAQGNPNSKVMVIGEAPENNEDLEGLPFRGDAGKVLDAMFGAIKMTRAENFYVTNVIFWRPPGNRRPTKEELAICRPFVERHIQLLNPEIVVLVGSTAMATILGISETISKVRGQFREFAPDFLDKAIKSFTIFHPSYLMRQPSKKKLAWQDMLALEEFVKSLS